MDERLPTVAFVLRVAVNPTGGLHGTIERVRTGEKHRFQGGDALTALIARLATSESPQTHVRSAE